MSIDRAGIILTNLIENKLAAEELELKESAIASSISGVGMTNLEGGIVYVNDALCKMWGYCEKEALLGKNVSGFFVGDGFMETGDLLKSRGFEKGEAVGIKADGSLFNVAYTANAILNRHGVPTRIFGSFVDITNLKQAVRELKHSKMQLEKLTNEVPAAIFQLRSVPAGKVSFEFLSKGISSVIPGIGANEMKEDIQNLFQRVYPPDAEAVTTTFLQSRDNLSNWHVEYRVTDGSGSLQWQKLLAHPEQAADGTLVWYGFIQNITERKSQEQEREKLIYELTQNNKDLRNFSFITSHNLRAPLSNLLGLVSLLDGVEMPDPYLSELFRGFKTSALHLNDTINDLLKVLIVRENPSITQEEIVLRDMMENVIGQTENLIAAAKAEIKLDVSQCPVVKFNKVYLESILLNLLTNAVKYQSPIRPLTVLVTSRDLGDKLQVVVTDNGMGLDTERYKDRLFGLYQRFHNNTDSKGFGLYMIKSQMEALGGKVEIESRVNEGTSMILTFLKASPKAG